MTGVTLEAVLAEIKQTLQREGAAAALAYAQQAYTQSGQDARLLMPLAQLHLATQQYDPAIQILDALSAANPGNPGIAQLRSTSRRSRFLAQQHGNAPFYPTVLALRQDVEAALAEGDIDYALTVLHEAAYRLVKETSRGDYEPGNDARLDALCLQAGAALAARLGLTPMGSDPDGPIVYVATAIHEFGGHSRVLLDYIRRQPKRRHVILLTEMNIRVPPAVLQPILDTQLAGIDYTILRSPGGRNDAIARWLFEQLAALKPAASFIFNHPYDPIGPAAIALLKPGVVYFNHHADGGFSLGASIAVTGHIDETPACHHVLCRATPGLNPLYIPLTIPDPGARDPQGFLAPRPLRTAVCASANKFTDQDYAYRYAEMVPFILARTDGEHLHIGPLPPDFLGLIAANLQRAGITAARFRHIANVPSLSRALGELDVDLYLTSFPGGGSKAGVEAMASGTPVLCHRNYLSRFGSGVADMMYPDALFWHDHDSLAAALQAAQSRPELARQSALARAHFDTHHAPAVVEQAWRDGKPRGLEPPPLPPHRPDRVQRAFDKFSRPAAKA
jgi:glycosyltransferase involved in cell wall biosynthesis